MSGRFAKKQPCREGSTEGKELVEERGDEDEDDEDEMERSTGESQTNAHARVHCRCTYVRTGMAGRLWRSVGGRGSGSDSG